jgi:hypothetical protein
VKIPFFSREVNDAKAMRAHHSPRGLTRSPPPGPAILLALLPALLPALAAGPGVGGSGQGVTGHGEELFTAARANDGLRMARRYYEGKVADNARDADSWHGLAVVLRRSELHAQAMLAMSRAVEIAPTPERHRELG